VLSLSVVRLEPAQAAVERLVTSDGERNVWLVGNAAECAVIDPAGPADDVVGHCGGRRLRAILWTSPRPASVLTALGVADRTGAVTYLHTDDLPIWRQAEPERSPQSAVPRGLVLTVGGVRLESIHTPGITPGALCWHAPALSVVFTGSTLVAEGADAVDRTQLGPEARSTLKASIRVGLFTLPSQTVVHPGRGPDTRIGTQRWDSHFWS
jgi:glyoxylase-like metal-dependent hydrolase (beta-lactamase superfamily II)